MEESTATPRAGDRRFRADNGLLPRRALAESTDDPAQWTGYGESEADHTSLRESPMHLYRLFACRAGPLEVILEMDDA